MFSRSGHRVMKRASAGRDPKGAPRFLYGLRRPSPTALAALLARESTGPVSYDEVGITGLSPSDSVPTPAPTTPDAHSLRVERSIGHGRQRFEQARAAILDWAGHRRAGAIVHPDRPGLEIGNEIALALRVWPLWVTAACRIVDVVDERDRFGFAYGTLAHHPESGEESFVVVRDPSTDEVRLEIVAVSRPASLPAKLGGPIGRLIQRFVAGRYLDGFEHPASMGRGPITSIRWWFENRRTGQLTVAQFPSWPLFAIGAATLLRSVTNVGATFDNATVNDGAGWLISGLWLYWGGDELVRGVNPWRRLLGVGVITWQVIRLLSS